MLAAVAFAEEDPQQRCVFWDLHDVPYRWLTIETVGPREADPEMTEHNKTPAAHRCAKQESLALNRSGGFPETREGKLHCREKPRHGLAAVKLCAFPLLASRSAKNQE